MKNNELILDGLLTVKEATDAMPFARPTIYSFIRDGKLPAIRVGKKIYLEQADINAFIEDIVKRSGETGWQ